MARDGEFDYASDMKEYYASDEVARRYHEAFAGGGDWRHRLIADRERAAVRALLERVPHGTVLDVPTGTGKLAPVFAETGSSVLACDVSANMLALAKREFARLGVEDARFAVCDAEALSSAVDESFDVAVCLRLLHRVPGDAKRRILAELGAVADRVIVSTGIESPYHAARRRIRRRLLGGDDRAHCYESRAATVARFADGFEIVASKRVLPVFSQEHVFLLAPERGARPHSGAESSRTAAPDGESSRTAAPDGGSRPTTSS